MRRKLSASKRVIENMSRLCDDDSSSSEEGRPSFYNTCDDTTGNSHKSLRKGRQEGRDSKYTRKKKPQPETCNDTSSPDDVDSTASTVITVPCRQGDPGERSSVPRKSRKWISGRPGDLKSAKKPSAPSNTTGSETEVVDVERVSPATETKTAPASEEPRSRNGKDVRKRSVSQSGSRKEARSTSGDRNDEEIDDCSSGKEFETSKITLEPKTCPLKLKEGKAAIGKQQSIRFIDEIVKILSKFKEVCSEFELDVDDVRRNHVSKQLLYEDTANNIVNRTRHLVKKLRSELNKNEKELTGFHRTWRKTCTQQQRKSLAATKESSGSETRQSDRKVVPEPESRSGQDDLLVSDCDSEQIFSENEKIVDGHANRSDAVETDSPRCPSPILAGSRGKRQTDSADRQADRGKSEKTNLASDSANDSSEDMFDPITPSNDVDSTSAESNKETDRSGDNVDPETEPASNAKKSGKDRHAIEEETNSKDTSPSDIFSGDSFEDELAKKAILALDSDELDEEKSSGEKADARHSKEPEIEEPNAKPLANKTRSRKANSGSEFDEEEEISKLESSANRPLSDVTSGDESAENDLAKKALLVSSNSESSSSENLSSKNRKLETSDTVKSSDDPKSSEESVGSRGKKKRLYEHRLMKADKKLRVSCHVVLKRLKREILAEHARALQKSRQYLDCKRIESLVNLDQLERRRRRLNASDQETSTRLTRQKRLAVKEKEDTLLDYLNKVENGEHLENVDVESDAEGNVENVKDVGETHTGFKSNEELISEADRSAKNFLLNMSDSDQEDHEVEPENGKSGDEKKEKPKKSSTNDKTTNSSRADKGAEENSEKSRWRQNKLLTTTFSDSNSDVEKEKYEAKQEKLSIKEGDLNSDENSENCDGIPLVKKKKKPRKILNSDSDVVSSVANSDSDSSVKIENDRSSDDSSSMATKSKKRTRKRESRKSSDTDSSREEKKTKPKRRRIKQMSTDSDSDGNKGTGSQGTPGKTGRKNIRKVMKDKQVTDDTKQAAKEEEERIQRIAERQKLYNEMYEARLAGEEKVDKLVLDFDPETKEELVTVHPELVKRLKPHQAKGIKFMWDASFESLERIKTSPGSGCIIAHCMGLGKTFQVIALLHTLLTHEQTGIRTIMIVCPLSTVLNWANEFKIWLKDIDDCDIDVFELTKSKKNFERRYKVEHWQREGGVLIIGYEMFRNLSGTKNKLRKKEKEAFAKCLVNPGADLIVCDEGHLLKNEDTALSKCMREVKTLRRIVLTGTPLQNNLVEYHCMVQFVKPNLLGTKREFLNRFVNPITNGQFDDSTEADVKLMKKRAYVLNKMLKGCVQRFDYSVLTPFLPPKQEYVIFVNLTEVQIKMYQHYLDHFSSQIRAGARLFADFQALQRIWTHPYVVRLNAEKVEKVAERRYHSSDETEGSLKDFIDDSTTSESETNSESSDDDIKSVHDSKDESNGGKTATNNVGASDGAEKKPEEAVNDEEWWLQFTQPEDFENIEVSSKLVLLFGILKECELIGDKVLIFSQSLYSLTLIEKFLQKTHIETQKSTNDEHTDGYTGTWLLGRDYFRLDGQTSPENRSTWCKVFNRPTNTRARLFLISTRAGGLGINLTAANRVIIFDASWNPSHDVQSIFRVYRFGQKKPCYVYRFLAAGTMEEKIYNRQVTKLSLSCRVVDEQQIERHYSNQKLSELYRFEPNVSGIKPTLNLPKDRLLAEIFLKYNKFVENYHEHDSLLENKAEEKLDEEERKQAWQEYEEEKKGKPPLNIQMPTFSNNLLLNQYGLPAQANLSAEYANLRELIRKDYPNATEQYQRLMTTKTLTDMYNYLEQTHNLQHVMMRQQPMQLQQVVLAPQNIMKTVGGQLQQLISNPYVKRVEATAAAAATSGVVDDDVVEITSTSSAIRQPAQNLPQVNSRNKNEEE